MKIDSMTGPNIPELNSMNETCGFKTAVPQLEQLEVEQSVKAFSNVQAVD